MEHGKEALKIARNLIKIGVVNSINASKGTVRVLFKDKDNSISEELPLLNHEYNMPSIGEQVICLFLGNSTDRGVCLNGFYSNLSLPPIKDQNIYYKDFGDGTAIEYSKTSKQLTIKATNPLIIDIGATVNGNVQINGDLHVNGSITSN